MFPWRKRNDGFEWRDYVRTTVLARRAHRRQQVEDLKQAAVERARDAARRGAEASKQGVGAGRRAMAETGVWLRDAARSGARSAKAAFGAGWGHAARAGRGALPAASAGAARIAGALRPGLSWTGARLAPVWAVTRRPKVEAQLAVTGGGLALASAARAVATGFDQAAMLTALAAMVALAVSLGPRLMAALPEGWGDGFFDRVGLPNIFQSRAVSGALLALAALVTVGALFWASSPPPRVAESKSEPEAAGTLRGNAVAVSGELLRLAGRTLRLSGIEAPERDQECQRPSGQDWRCGAAAARALTSLVRGRPVTCDLSGTDDSGHAVAVCRAGDRDVAGELVKRGHVFAAPSLLGGYGGLETEAKAKRAGIWSGGAERPSRYRAKRWEEAKRQAPDGCPIKGQMTNGGRVYVLPWSGAYDKIKLRLGRGERWFCSEDEARAAGWKPG